MENKAFTFASWYSIVIFFSKLKSCQWYWCYTSTKGMFNTWLIPFMYILVHTYVTYLFLSLYLSLYIHLKFLREIRVAYGTCINPGDCGQTVVRACVHEFSLWLHFKFLTCNRGMIFRFFTIIVFLISYKVVVSIKFKMSGSHSVCHILDTQ